MTGITLKSRRDYARKRLSVKKSAQKTYSMRWVNETIDLLINEISSVTDSDPLLDEIIQHLTSARDVVNEYSGTLFEGYPDGYATRSESLSAGKDLSAKNNYGGFHDNYGFGNGQDILNEKREKRKKKEGKDNDLAHKRKLEKRLREVDDKRDSALGDIDVQRDSLGRFT